MLRVRTAITGWEGGPGLMTSYFETPLQDAAAAIRALQYVHGYLLFNSKFLFPNGVSLQVSSDVDVITAATGDITNTWSSAVLTPVVGLGGESKAPPSVAALLRLRTATFIAGRRVVGRSFFSPLAASVVTSDGILGDVSVTGLVAAGNSVLGALSAGDFWVVWHRPKLGVGGSIAPVVAVTVPTKLAVLTSRRD